MPPIDTGLGLATMGGVVYDGGLVQPVWAALNENNSIHFGLNETLPFSDFSWLRLCIVPRRCTLYKDPGGGYYLRHLGPRVYDIFCRGGRVAEYNWFQSSNHLYSEAGALITAPLAYCLDTTRFDAFNQGITARPAKRAFGLGAQISGVNVHNVVKYQSTNPHLYAVVTKHNDSGGLQMGVRWSKTALEFALKHGHAIHFHLDGMDITNALGKAGAFSHNVTVRELRYIHRHWDRFQGNVTFYNGLVYPPNPVRADNQAYQVPAPWLLAAPTHPFTRTQIILASNYRL